MLDTPPPKMEEQDCVWKQTLRPSSPHPRFSLRPSLLSAPLPPRPRRYAPPGMRRHTAFAASFFATSGKWGCWLQVGDSPAKPFGTAHPRWLGLSPAPRGTPPARVSACGPPASYGACGFRSGQPFPCRAPSGVPPPRRHFPAPPHAPSHGRRGRSPVTDAPAGSPADGKRAAFRGRRPVPRPAYPPPYRTCGSPFAAPARRVPRPRTANGRMDGHWPPYPPGRTCAVSGAFSFRFYGYAGHPAAPPRCEQTLRNRLMENSPAPAHGRIPGLPRL